MRERFVHGRRDGSATRPKRLKGGKNLADIFYRFLIGGFVVSVFAMLGDVFKPKSFAGLFGAAPSVALATLGLTVLKQGKPYAAIESRWMMAGVAAFFVYAQCVSFMLLRLKWPALAVSLLSLLIWLITALGLWWCIVGLLQ